MAASTITPTGHGQIKNAFSSTGAEDLAFDCFAVTLDGAATDPPIYCNHANKGTITTKAVRQALCVMVTPTQEAAMAAAVLKAGSVISTTTYTNDTVTIHGLTTGTYDVLIIGRANS